ncbi:copper chaperone PCu(A)C [Streptomyces roseirectus]|uniref:Copper chaperone PCu(A)C n=1 Tax=Streptomyces roseirectus TaxID=2768066 RepID=A0A7H0IFW0_9ACTN|nr:copper chaperone PCu(A)C [Streptomyces roseirectus]QNP71676.1 copper chaperone PCu(A)C [Streptomyces roseirectus]
MRYAAIGVGAALLLAGCGSSADSGPALSVDAAYIPQPVSDMAAGFLTIRNEGGTKDELTSVTSDAGPVTVHETSGGTMSEVASLDVPAHGRLVFRSGGNHLMFEKLERKPRQGEKVTVTLHFAESKDLKVEIPVESATYVPKTGN